MSIGDQSALSESNYTSEGSGGYSRFISTSDLSHNFDEAHLHLISFKFKRIELEPNLAVTILATTQFPYIVSAMPSIKRKANAASLSAPAKVGFSRSKTVRSLLIRSKPARAQKLAKNQYDGETSATHGMMSAAMMDDMIDDDDEDDEEDEGESGDDEEEDQDMQSLDEDDASLEGEEQAASAFQDLEEADEDDTKVARPKKNDKALFRPPTAEEMEMLKREGEDRGSSFGFSMKVRRCRLY